MVSLEDAPNEIQCPLRYRVDEQGHPPEPPVKLPITRENLLEILVVEAYLVGHVGGKFLNLDSS